MTFYVVLSFYEPTNDVIENDIGLNRILTCKWWYIPAKGSLL